MLNDASPNFMKYINGQIFLNATKRCKNIKIIILSYCYRSCYSFSQRATYNGLFFSTMKIRLSQLFFVLSQLIFFLVVFILIVFNIYNFNCNFHFFSGNIFTYLSSYTSESVYKVSS